MQQRLAKFLVVLLLICYGEIFAQKKSFVKPFSFSATSVKFQPYKEIQYCIIGKEFYSKNLGFFCRKELQIEKKTSIPLRFRLGSLDYTNFLEQKLNARNFILKE
jgi:hypothetical protein